MHEIIDLKKYELKNNSWISSKTIEKVKYHLEKGDQVLFFLIEEDFHQVFYVKIVTKFINVLIVQLI